MKARLVRGHLLSNPGVITGGLPMMMPIRALLLTPSQCSRHPGSVSTSLGRTGDELQPSKRLIGWTLEGSACWRHENMIVIAEMLSGQDPTPRERMLRTNGDDIALPVKQSRR